MENGKDLNAIIKGIVAGKTEEQAEKAMLKELGFIPEIWDDPVTRSNLLSQPMGQTVAGAHINNFKQSYEEADRLGSSAAGVGYRRNIEGQGMPDADKWYTQAVADKQEDK